MERTCSRCKQTKDISRFSKRSDRPSGVQSKCKDCERIYRKMYYKPHEKIRQQLKITQEDYEALVNKSQGACEVCGDTEGRLCIDHCHDTKKVRGMLCHNCNTALGLIKDNKETLRSLIQYLEQEEQLH